MADITIDAAASGNTARGLRRVVFTTTLIGYFFFVDADTGFKYSKTTDGGATWGAVVTIKAAAEVVVAYDVWFDQWTPGITGTLVHLWYFGTTGDDVFYNTLDTNGDTLGTERTVFNGATAVAGRGVFVSGAKMRGGNLYCCFDIDAGAEHGTSRSIDAGVNWTTRTDVVEATIDQALVFPGNEADNQDAWFLYHDASTDEFTLKVHDDSANTNSESTVIATLIENTADGTGQIGFQGAIHPTNGHLIVALWTDRDTATADFRAFDINGTGAITELTALATDKDDCYYPSVYVAANGEIYVAYVGKRDGSETLDTTAGIYYVKSTDGGATWSAGDLAYAASQTDYRFTSCPLNGPLFLVAFMDISALAWMTNVTNSVIPAAVPGVASWVGVHPDRVPTADNVVASGTILPARVA